MVADPGADVANFVDRAEIERAAPDERLDLGQEPLTQRKITGARPGANECRPLPRQRLRLIIRDGRIDRQHDRRDLGRGAKPQIDPRDIAILGTLLEQFDHSPSDPHRRFPRIVAWPARERLGVEQQDEINIGRIIQFAAAQFAQRQHRETGRAFARTALLDRGGQRAVDRVVGEIGQSMGQLLEAELARQITKRNRKCESAAAQPETLGDMPFINAKGRYNCRFTTVGGKIGFDGGECRHCIAQEGRMGSRPSKRRPPRLD